MKINFKKNGAGYTSGATIAFGSNEMKKYGIVDKNGNLKNIESVEVINDNKIIINLKEVKDVNI